VTCEPPPTSATAVVDGSHIRALRRRLDRVGRRPGLARPQSKGGPGPARL